MDATAEAGDEKGDVKGREWSLKGALVLLDKEGAWTKGEREGEREEGTEKGLWVAVL